jgi:hypothetical protein
MKSSRSKVRGIGVASLAGRDTRANTQFCFSILVLEPEVGIKPALRDILAKSVVALLTYYLVAT